MTKAKTPTIEVTEENPLGLEPFEGEAVTELGITIPSAGGGFHEALSVDMRLIDLLKHCTRGDTVFAVFELVKVKANMEPAKDHDGWRRVDVFSVNGVAVIEPDQAVGVIQEQRDRVQAIKDNANGTPQLENDGPSEADAAAQASDASGNVTPIDQKSKGAGK